MRRVCLDMIHELAKKDDRICFVGSDLGFETLKDFRDTLPERFFMEGINEAHAVGMAAGLAMDGKIVYVNTIATFLTRRSYEQLILDLCLHKVNVRLVGNGGGLVYAPLGPTHLAFEDIAIARTMPNMTVVAPADAEEMARFMPLSVDHPGPIYIRLGKGYDPIVTRKEDDFIIGKAIVMRNGKDALIITTGITLKLGLAAAEALQLEGIDAAVLHMPTIKPLDTDSILEMTDPVRSVVAVEEHSIIGGLGSAVAEVLAEADWSTPKRFKRIGLPDCFPAKYGSQESLMNHYGINSQTIVETIRKSLETDSKPIAGHRTCKAA
jgi:transketolase